MFLAACLAGRSADEAGAREAFGWLDGRQKGAICAADVKLLTGEVRCLVLLSCSCRGWEVWGVSLSFFALVAVGKLWGVLIRLCVFLGWGGALIG